MKTALILAALGLLFAGTTAHAQSTLLQGGPWTPGHLPIYSNPGFGQPVLVDGGGSGGGALGVNPNELGVTSFSLTGQYPVASGGNGPNGEHGCFYDAPITNATGYHAFCLDPNAQGGGLLSYGAYGAATPLPLNIIVNGVAASFPGATFLRPGATAVSPSLSQGLLYDNNGVLGDSALGAGVLAATTNALNGANGLSSALAVNSTLTLAQSGGFANLALNLANANTWTAGQTINVGTGAIAALTTTQALSGASAGLNANLFSIPSDAIIAGTGNIDAVGIRHFFGGSTGARNALFSYLEQTAPSTTGTGNPNYSAVNGRVKSDAGDGGTGLTSGTAAGAYFGVTGQYILANGATFVQNATSFEGDAVAQTGSSIFEKSVVQLGGACAGGCDAISGSLVDTIVWLNSAAATTSGFNDAILIGTPTGGNGRFPLSATGNIIRVACSCTTGTAFDLSLASLTNILKGPGSAIVIDGGGNITTSGALKLSAASGLIQNTATTSAAISFDFPNAASTPAESFQLFRNTTGIASNSAFKIFIGNNTSTTQTFLAADSASYINAQAGDLTIGSASDLSATLGVSGTMSVTGVITNAGLATGTPAASVCVDASNHIIKKTTTGSCV